MLPANWKMKSILGKMKKGVFGLTAVQSFFAIILGVALLAYVIVINKADRPGAEIYLKNLYSLLHHAAPDKKQPEVVKTVATKNEGIKELLLACYKVLALSHNNLKAFLLAEKAYKLIQNERMKPINKSDLKSALEQAYTDENFNLYTFVKAYILKIKP